MISLPNTGLPSTITVELFTSPSEPVYMKELGENYLKEIGYPMERMDISLKISIGQKTCKGRIHLLRIYSKRLTFTIRS